jgi:transposase InsO family protein
VTVEERGQVLALVTDAVDRGARQHTACAIVGVAERTLQRWQRPETAEDGRRGPNTVPRNTLSPHEREQIVAITARPEFCNTSPHQIVPRLADRGEYVASESSFYRVLKTEQLLAHRGRASSAHRARPRAYDVTAPRTLFSWDITYLLSAVRGQYYYLYLFVDVFSRKAVGADVHAEESMAHSAQLLERICREEGIEHQQVSVHADNGGPMKGATMLATMQRLGVMPSFSRPSVSNDNPYSEALFRTVKYCPLYPTKPFASLEEARAWVATFVQWYNEEHLHSGIRFTTPASRHSGTDIAMLQHRDRVYQAAQRTHPARWSGTTRNWTRIARVTLNGGKDGLPSAATAHRHTARTRVCDRDDLSRHTEDRLIEAGHAHSDPTHGSDGAPIVVSRATVCETLSAPGGKSRQEEPDRTRATATGYVNGINKEAGSVSMENGRLRS